MTLPQDRVFDWAPHHDPRSRQYPVRATLATEVPRTNRLWRSGKVPLDQRAEGECVGFGWTHEAISTPVAVDFNKVLRTPTRDPREFARLVYARAQDVDEWAGNSYEGTSVNAGAKVVREFGLLKEWRWAFGIQDTVDTIVQRGPVVLGINWYSGMYEAPGGILERKGQWVGGHCIVANGYRLRGEIFAEEAAVGIYNSWGPDWGRNGQAWIRESSLSSLLQEDGEAAIPFRRSYGRA